MKRILSVVAVFCAVSAFGQRELPIHRGRLTSDLNAGGYNITNLAPGFAASIGALTNPAQFATPADVAAATEGMLTVESDPVALPVASNALALASAALQSEVDPIAYPVASNALALASTALQPAATNGMLTAEADTLATVTARGATTLDAVTIGSRRAGDVGVSSFANGENVVASGEASHAEGGGTTASGYASHAEGSYTTASGYASHAEGRCTTASGAISHASGFNVFIPDSDHGAFAWQGSSGYLDEQEYGSHGPGTYNINPVGGLAGLWIGETTLAFLLNAKASYLAATNIAAAAVAGSGHAMAEQVVSGAVGTAESGCRYFWTSATNVVLSVNLTPGQVVNLAKLNNTGANSITAIGQVGWEWTGGDMTNTIAAGKSMTFGFLIDAATGKTNAYATGVSK